jgi:hypothetical protein
MPHPSRNMEPISRVHRFGEVIVVLELPVRVVHRDHEPMELVPVPLQTTWINVSRERSKIAFVRVQLIISYQGRDELRPSAFAYRATLQLHQFADVRSFS